MTMNRLLKKIKEVVYSLALSKERYARHVGVRIGKNCMIATRKWSSEPYLIFIGDNVQVTNDVYFHTHGGGHVARKDFPNFDVFGKIIIKDGAYIGSGSHIMPGVTIGKQVLVAAGSIVTKSVPDKMVVAGNPAKIICSVADYIEKNKKYNVNTKGLSFKEKKHYLLSLDDEMFIHK